MLAVQQAVAANPLHVFTFESHTLQTFTAEDQVWFSATDVCSTLGLLNPSDVLKRLDGDEKAIDTVYTLGGEQQKLIVNESGLYSLILTSRKPAAKRFKRWVTHEVLPAIRRTGTYTTQPSLPLPPPTEVLALKDILNERFSLSFDSRYSGEYVTVHRMTGSTVMVDIRNPEGLANFMRSVVPIEQLGDMMRVGTERVMQLLKQAKL